MVADLVLCGIETVIACNKLTSTFQKIDHRMNVHTGCLAGVELCVRTEMVDDGLGQ